MKKFRLAVLFSFLLISISCTKTEVEPTGSLKVNFTSSGITKYFLMTEAAAGSSGSGLYLRTGDITGLKSFVIDDLNPGDYVLSINNLSKAVQVTAGRQREYTF